MDIIDGEIVGSRAARFLEYVAMLNGGRVVTRREMCDIADAPYSSVRYNLERAVAEGYLNKYYGLTENSQPAWFYAQKSTMPKLPGIEVS